MKKEFKIALVILLFVVLLFISRDFVPGFKDGFMEVANEMQ